MSARNSKEMAQSEERFEEDDDVSSPGKHDGRDVNSSTARKAQNRIAQREFRLRKQQYIRDLEAKVEVLSGDREERLELMTVLIRNLLKENADLRGMVRSMASFVGEGLGSCLPRLGLNSEGLDAILNRADTDTAYEAFVALKNARELQKDNPPSGLPQPVGEGKRKRKNAAEDTSKRETPLSKAQTTNTWSPPDSQNSSQPPKKSRRESSPPAPSAYRNLFPANAVASSSKTSFESATAEHGPPSLPPPPRLATYDDLNLGLQMGQPPQAQSVCGDGGAYHNAMYGSTPQRPVNDYYRTQPPYPEPLTQMNQPQNQLRQQMLTQQHQPPPSLPPIASFTQHPPEPAQRQLSSRSGSPTLSYQHTPVVTSPPDAQEQRSQRVREALLAVNVSGVGGMTQEMRDKLVDSLGTSAEDQESKREALELVSYHLNNFRANPNYNLPTSLMPTIMQRSIPHEHAIDGIIFPAIRERMITYRGKYDLLEAMNGIITGSIIHGDDTLDHRNWEFSEQWLTEFSLLTNHEVYEVTNKWRTERGEPPLVRPDRPKVVLDYDKIMERSERS